MDDKFARVADVVFSQDAVRSALLSAIPREFPSTSSAFAKPSRCTPRQQYRGVRAQL